MFTILIFWGPFGWRKQKSNVCSINMFSLHFQLILVSRDEGLSTLHLLLTIFRTASKHKSTFLQIFFDLYLSYLLN